MFTIFIWIEGPGWWTEGVYDCEYFDPKDFKEFDKRYSSWYARPDDEAGEEFLHIHGII